VRLCLWITIKSHDDDSHSTELFNPIIPLDSGNQASDSSTPFTCVFDSDTTPILLIFYFGANPNWPKNRMSRPLLVMLALKNIWAKHKIIECFD
jgi:hypothetical protein